jgi:hypothetical protein
VGGLRSRVWTALAVAGALGGMALAAPAAVSAATRPAALKEGASISAAASRRPFRIKAGKVYYVHASVRGVRRGERLALESRYWGRWHRLGSWPMHRGSYRFYGRARSTRPGLYTLRVQFQRRGRLERGTASNTFRVRVLGFHVPKPRRPHRNADPGARPSTPLSDWTSVACAPTTPGLGHGVVVPSPLAQLTNFTGHINQVVWSRDALPGGSYGKWYIANTTPQYITPPAPDEVSIGGSFAYGSDELTTSDDLQDTLLDFGAVTEYHQIAWDMQIQDPSTGNWYYVNPTQWYTPGSYVQYGTDGISTSQSANCETYQAPGR